jgi:hypothetical protein
VNALKATQQWLERAVIGLNLCPFAKAVHTKGQIRWVLCDATEPVVLLELLAQELKYLAAADPAEIDTTLIVHPRVLQDFHDFNDFVGVAEDSLAGLGLEGTLQIASFHPQFQFADAPADDITNATNRSPHPTLHLLREDSIERAVQAFPEAEAIYERNMQTLRELGHEGWQRLLER